MFLAEGFGTLRDIYLLKQNKHLQSLFNGICSALWCVKVVVVISQPISIMTGFLGAYLGSYFAFWLENIIKNFPAKNKYIYLYTIKKINKSHKYVYNEYKYSDFRQTIFRFKELYSLVNGAGNHDYCLLNNHDKTWFSFSSTSPFGVLYLKKYGKKYKIPIN